MTLCVALAAVLSCAALASEEYVTISQEDYQRYQQFDKLLEIMDYLDIYYYQDFEVNDLLDGAAAGLLRGLDDEYSFYYTPEDYAELWEDDKGEYAGIGIQITGYYTTGICKVTRVFENSPAQEAGVRRGDILYRVGEELFVSAENLDDAVEQIRGVPGSTANVTFLQDGEEITLDIPRASVTVNRLKYANLGDGIGYIYLYEFAGDCETEFEDALNSLLADGAKGVIIDLRDNPGGWVDQAQYIADLFVDEGEVCYVQYRDGGQEHDFPTFDGKTDVKLVILLNENSASSSEILSGCLQERADATVVGVQSFGKGVMQTVVELGEDGSGMQFTFAQYFLPSGAAVHHVGITPDVECPLPEGDIGEYEFASPDDPQLRKAIEVMAEKLAE